MTFNSWFSESDPDDPRAIYVWYLKNMKLNGKYIGVMFWYHYHDAQTNPNGLSFVRYDEGLTEMNMSERSEKLVKKLGTKKNMNRTFIAGVFENDF